MTASDFSAALTPVLEALTNLGVRHYVGGSVASSAYGIARASLDVDVIAELGPSHVDRFVAALRERYHLDQTRVRNAVDTRSSFNLIHLATMFKVDVFVSKDRAFDRSAFARIRVEAGNDDAGRVGLPLASAEDVLLAKLEWYQRGGEVSERQWADVAGILKVGRGGLDLVYLKHWAMLLGVGDLLQRSLEAERTDASER